jgi:hypothetical protein
VNGREAEAFVTHTGCHVFPITPWRKAPPIPHDWERKASADPRIVGMFWPTAANLGIAAGRSGLAVSDHGPSSDEAFDRVRAGRPLPATRKVTSPREGGYHLYWRQPPGIQIRNSQGKVCPGVDIRGHGGYIVVPGSVRASLGLAGVSG